MKTSLFVTLLLLASTVGAGPLLDSSSLPGLYSLGEEGADFSVSNRGRPRPQSNLGLHSTDGEKSLLNALWRSLLLPGWGEAWLGAEGRAKLFYMAEAGVWSSTGIYKTQEYLRKRNYVEMGEIHAGVQGAQDDQFWKNAGLHDNWQDFNENLRWEARREYGYGSEAYYDYIAEHEITSEEEGWRWNNRDRRIDFARKRESSLSARRMARNTLFVGLIATRAVSIFDTIRLHRNREGIREIRKQEVGSLDADLWPTASGFGYRLRWSRSF
ncbi:MAG: hypothetical protein QGG33_02540 [Candidatus Krumholzibacteria bacterium]|jgi:hypothetical protein|nr:hypothetical protein [Candidatus Krumholzibacteria bacterium]MDP7020739.1 hypothetical protein [Candidatus Krumholzibacteria bacterium]